MGNVLEKMNHQYGATKVGTDFPKWILCLIKNFGINREAFAMELIKKHGFFGKNSFLDIGCGDGELCFKNKNNFKNIYGIDISTERISRAKKNYINIDFSVQDLNYKLNFENECFDCITSLVTFDWIYDLNNALSETHRVLKDDGIFVLQVNNLGFIMRRLQLFFGQYPKISAFSPNERKKIGRDASVCHMFTKKTLKAFLGSFGFEIIETTGSGFSYKLRNWWPSLLCGDLVFVCKKTI